MRKPGGYAVLVSPESQVVNFDGMRRERVDPGSNEYDCFTCAHCNRIIHVRARANPDEFGSMCRNCMKMVCPTCADQGCTPFLKKIDEAEEREIRYRQNMQWI
jgi:hypothetical protein